MVIYHGTTTWHILECWTHRINKHKEDDAILILPDFILDKFPNILKDFPDDIFKIKIIRYRKINYNLETELFEQQLEKLVNEAGLYEDIEASDEIYVAGAQYMFSHYLVNKGIKFHFIEEAPGRLTTSEIVMENLYNINKIQYEIALKDGMFIGNSEMVKSIVCNVSAQIDGAELPANVEDFNVIQELHNISEEELNKIKEYFGVPSLSFPKDTVLVLTQHFANLNMTSYVEQALLYQMTIDYFLENENVYIKPHPDDLMNYKYELENCEVIKGKFPSELLHVISKNKPQKLMAISSSSILNLKKYYSKIISFNSEYLQTFYLNYQYHLVARMIKQLDVKNVMVNGINKPQFSNMLEVVGVKNVCIHDTEDEKQNDLWFITSFDEKTEMLNALEYRRDGVFVFLDSVSWCLFAGDKDSCLNNGICKPIKLKAIDVNESSQEGVFYLYIYCENEKIRKEIADMHYVKKLINSGIETTVPKLDDKDMEIAALKGILNATEKRLQIYLDKEKEQRKDVVK